MSFGLEAKRGHENVEWLRTVIQTNRCEASSENSHHTMGHRHGTTGFLWRDYAGASDQPAAFCTALASFWGPFCSSCSAVTVTWDSAFYPALTQRKEHGPRRGVGAMQTLRKHWALVISCSRGSSHRMTSVGMSRAFIQRSNRYNILRPVTHLFPWANSWSPWEYWRRLTQPELHFPNA